MLMKEMRSTAVDAETGVILEMISSDAVHVLDRAAVIEAIRSSAAEHAGVIDPNLVRRLIPTWVYPRVIGPTYRSLAHAGVISPAGWVASDDKQGRNFGKPARRYKWNFCKGRSLDQPHRS